MLTMLAAFSATASAQVWHVPAAPQQPGQCPDFGVPMYLENKQLNDVFVERRDQFLAQNPGWCPEPSSDEECTTCGIHECSCYYCAENHNWCSSCPGTTCYNPNQRPQDLRRVMYWRPEDCRNSDWGASASGQCRPRWHPRPQPPPSPPSPSPPPPSPWRDQMFENIGREREIPFRWWFDSISIRETIPDPIDTSGWPQPQPKCRCFYQPEGRRKLETTWSKLEALAAKLDAAQDAHVREICCDITTTHLQLKDHVELVYKPPPAGGKDGESEGSTTSSTASETDSKDKDPSPPPSSPTPLCCVPTDLHNEAYRADCIALAVVSCTPSAANVGETGTTCIPAPAADDPSWDGWDPAEYCSGAASHDATGATITAPASTSWTTSGAPSTPSASTGDSSQRDSSAAADCAVIKNVDVAASNLPAGDCCTSGGQCASTVCNYGTWQCEP